MASVWFPLSTLVQAIVRVQVGINHSVKFKFNHQHLTQLNNLNKTLLNTRLQHHQFKTHPQHQPQLPRLTRPPTRPTTPPSSLWPSPLQPIKHSSTKVRPVWASDWDSQMRQSKDTHASSITNRSTNSSRPPSLPAPPA